MQVAARSYWNEGADAQRGVLKERGPEDLAEWLKSDASAAREWIASAMVQERFEDLIVEALALTSSDYPELTIDVASVLAEGPRNHVVGLALERWVRRDRVRASEWFCDTGKDRHQAPVCHSIRSVVRRRFAE